MPAPLGGENFVLSELEDEVFTGRVADVAVRASREGRFIFDFSDNALLAEPQEDLDFDRDAALAVNRAELLNSHVLCLHVALARTQHLALPKTVVSPLDFISYQSADPPPSYGWIEQRLTPLLTAGSLASYNELSPTTFDWRLSQRPTLTIETVAESCALLETIFQRAAPRLLPVTDLYLRGTAFYEAHDYNLALVSAWAAVETLLQSQWQRYLDSNRTRLIDGIDVAFINADRRDRLMGGRDFTASVMSEVLSLLGELPHSLYADLHLVRRDRNGFMHELSTVSRQAADRALSVAERMLGLVEGLDLAVSRLSRLGG